MARPHFVTSKFWPTFIFINEGFSQDCTTMTLTQHSHQHSALIFRANIETQIMATSCGYINSVEDFFMFALMISQVLVGLG